MRWWVKAILFGIALSAASSGLGYLATMFFPEVGWHLLAIVFLTLAGLAMLGGAFLGGSSVTRPPHFMNLQSHGEIHSMAFAKEVGRKRPDYQWNPDVLVAGLPPFGVALVIGLWVILTY